MDTPRDFSSRRSAILAHELTPHFGEMERNPGSVLAGEALPCGLASNSQRRRDSVPADASLFQQRRTQDFSRSVSRAVSRLFAVGMLVSAWMIALAPWLMDLFRGGRFQRADAVTTTHLFGILRHPAFR